MESVKGSQTSLAPALVATNNPHFDANMDYVISDYMDRLGTRLNILETELKYAWRALDLLSQEYIKMWERLEKLEGLLYEQQSVISQLLDFYTSGGGDNLQGSRVGEDGMHPSIENRLGQLEVIREILGNGTVEDGLEEGIDVTRSASAAATMITTLQLEMGMDEIHVPDEAFYRSLNQAYREDLVCDEVLSRPPSQLGMIWEEAEDGDDGNSKKDELKELEAAAMSDETQEVFSALDYKDYRGNSPCISEQDLAQLSRISSIDHIAMEKLHELNRLTNKIQQDSINLKELQSRLQDNSSEIEAKAIAEDTSIIDEQLREIYNESDNWNFGNSSRGLDDLMLLSANETNSRSNSVMSKRSNSRLSIADSNAGTDAEVAETLASGFRTPTSPRRRIHIEATTCNAPYTTVTGRLAYSAAVMNAEVNASSTGSNSKIHSSNKDKYDLNPFKYSSNSELNQLIAASYETVPCISPVVYSVTGEKAKSPTPSMCSVRTRQDGYIGSTSPGEEREQSPAQSPSPPPPAPLDHCETFLMPDNSIVPGPQRDPSPVFLSAPVPQSTSISSHDHTQHGRLSPRTPHSPKSPRASPKHSKSSSSNIVAAKSDSGLSSMSGWSSLEKSPGSPKNSIPKLQQQASYLQCQQLQHNRAMSPMPPAQVHPTPIFPPDNRPFTESDTDSFIRGPLQVPVCNAILPGGHHLSAFTTVKSPCSLQSSEGYGNFVPAPAPASDINVSPRRKSKHHTENKSSAGSRDYAYTYEQPPAIYSVAGSNRQEAFTSVYTSNSADYIPQTTNYPDLIEPYGNNESHNAPSSPRYPPEPEYYAHTTIQPTMPTHSTVSSTAGKRPLAKVLSTNTLQQPDGVANHEGYKTAMYRTMFPTGNITDALSYYPTSTRYESAVSNLPRANYNDPSSWLSCPPDNSGKYPQEDSDSFSSSSHGGVFIDPRRLQQQELQRQQYQQQQQDLNQQQQHLQQQQQQQQPIYQNQQPIYQNQQQIQNSQSYQQIENNGRMWNQRPNMPYLELDLRNRNIPDYMMQPQHQQQQYQQHQQNKQRPDQFYDPSGVIVSQSGYISISSDLKEVKKEEKPVKKCKRSNTLKSAMSSVSHWLPDLHLTKRHRSHSLPSGVRREDLESQSRGNVPPRSRMSLTSMSRKKKKNALVSTVSGILQKAKRRAQQQQQQQQPLSLSDPEQSDSEWTSSRMSSSLSEDDRSEDSSVFSDGQAENLFAKVTCSRNKTRKQSQHELNQQKTELYNQQQMQRELQHQLQKEIQQTQYPSSKEIIAPEEPEPEIVTEDESGKSTGSASMSMFPTVGEIKRPSGQSDKSDDSTTSETKSFPPVTLGGASMEFAVSRALGKYRQRQSFSASDEPTAPEDVTPNKPEEVVEYEEGEEKTQPETKEQATPYNNQEINYRSAALDEHPENSPSTASLRGHINRFLPRHQQSLEIPGRDDDDIRSMHSWRSGSRVSSRRQSTEDSIDSEDEWYCYELRKLEEMEKQSQFEADIEEIVEEEPEEELGYDPKEDIKEKMSFVLRELRMKAKVVEGILDEQDNKKQVLASMKRREQSYNKSKSIEDEKDPVFEKITDYHPWKDFPASAPPPPPPPPPPPAEPSKETLKTDDRDDHSSGDTSGPDSPQHSMDEDDEVEIATEEMEHSRRNSGREGSMSVPSSEVSVTDRYEDDTATIRSGSIETASTSTVQLPKIKIDNSSCSSKDDAGKDTGALGSKWKLLKALKERKAEEKNQEKVQETPVTNEKEKVSSMMSMMQKFYEIHVKT